MDVTGLLLAGGASRRFGTDKAWAVVAGRPMIAHSAEALAAVAAPLLVSVREASVVLPVGRPARYVVDRYAEAGPLAGLHAGLDAATTPWLLALACDLPFVTPSELRALLDACTPAADAVVARTPDGRRHPLCAAYHRRVRRVAEAHLEAGTLALHALLDALGAVVYVDLPAARLRNVNRPVDLKRGGA